MAYRDGSRLNWRRTPNVVLSFVLLYLATTADGLHHMKRLPVAYVSRRDENVPLVVKNLCAETIYPGIVTQSGTPPSSGGFELQSGQTKNFTVGADWQGRVWGRTNCSFNAAGTGPSNDGGLNGGGVACGTGDCGGILECKATVCTSLWRSANTTESVNTKIATGSNTSKPCRIHTCFLKWPNVLRHLACRWL